MQPRFLAVALGLGVLTGCDPAPPALDQLTDEEPPPDPPARLIPAVDGAVEVWPLGGGLSVRVTAHTVADIPCWTVVTSGMPGGELALTVRRDRGASLLKLPELFAALAPATAQKPCTPGLLSQLVPTGTGILGCSRFYAILYAEPLAMAGVEGTESAALMVLLDAREAELTYAVGPLRLLARLGYQSRFYPTTPWADPQRESLVADGPGTLAGIPTLFADRLTVTRVDDDTLRIVADPSQLVALQQGVPGGMLRLFALASRGSHGTFVWHPGLPPTAIGPVGTGRALALNGLLLGREEARSVGFVEDYVGITLPPEEHDRFVEALITGRATTFTFDGEVKHVHVEPFTGHTLYLPHERSERSTGAIHLFTPESELPARVEVDALGGALRTLSERIEAFCAERPPPDAGLGLRVLWSPDGVEVGVASRTGPPSDPAWCEALVRAVQDVPPPPTTGPVEAVLELPGPTAGSS